MPQSSFHVAIIMDGNGRWATRRGRPRLAGHRAGATAVRRTIEAAADLGIDVLTLYAFSGDNWSRPKAEVDGLMALFTRYLKGETATFVKNGIRLSIIGRRDRVAPRPAARGCTSASPSITRRATPSAWRPAGPGAWVRPTARASPPCSARPCTLRRPHPTWTS